MCRILVRWKEKPPSLTDLVKHNATKSVVGDPIVAMPDGHVWGREEGLPWYVSLDIDGVPPQEIRRYIIPEQTMIVDASGKHIPLYKRAYNINLSLLPEKALDSLRADGFAKVSWSDLRIVRKRNGEVVLCQ